MNSVRNYGMANSVSFQGAKMDKMKNIAMNQAIHLITQGTAWGVIETWKPSTSLLDVVVRKISIDLAEVIANKFQDEVPKLSIDSHGLNVFAYLTELKNQAKKLF